MKWSTTPPAEPGWYWVREKGDADGIDATVVWLEEWPPAYAYDDGWRVKEVGSEEVLPPLWYQQNGYVWAGPLSPPAEDVP